MDKKYGFGGQIETLEIKNAIIYLPKRQINCNNKTYVLHMMLCRLCFIGTIMRML